MSEEPGGLTGDQLELERSGGFAGLQMGARVPLLELSEAQAAAVRDCLDAAPARAEPPAGLPDRFVYRLAVGGREAWLAEPDFPAALRPLLPRLSPRFKQQGP